MKTRAAVLWEPGSDWTLEDVEMDGPRSGEVLVDMRACGMCHSDDHVHSGDLPVPHYPFIGGHEGAAEVLEVGPDVVGLAPGDHVAFSFMPSCGACAFCLSGRAFLCDDGAKLFDTGMMTDGRIAHHIGDTPVARFAQLGAFSEQQLLSDHSVVKVDPDIPWHAVALVSCGVATGFGSAVNRAGVAPGDTVAVIGTGGVGISAIQGARIAGARRIIAIDPLESRREQAKVFGATHAFASVEEATPAVAELTWGNLCEKVIATPGVMTGALVEPALGLTAKGGTLVVTAIGNMLEMQSDLNLFFLAMTNKEIKGCLYGSGNPRTEIPKLLGLYRDGLLKIDEMVTRTYPLREVNQGYADMKSGANVRGVLTF